MMIDGKTRTLGLLGDPVEHTMSPLIHNTLSEKLGLNNVYVPFHTKAENLEAAVKGAYALNILGLNVTVPHKNEVMQYLSELDEGGQAIGAVNTLVRTENGYKGYNTDMMGLLREVRSYGVELDGQDVIILGAGGAAKAVAYMCVSNGAGLLFFSLTEVSYPVQLITHQCSSVKTFLSDLDRLQVHRIFQSTFLLHEHSLLPFGS